MKWHYENHEAVKARMRADYLLDRESRLDRGKDYYQSHKTEFREASRLWKKNNPEKIKASLTRYRLDHLLQMRIKESCRRSRKALAGGSYSISDIFDIHKDQRRKCALCKVSIAKKYHIDHIKPIARGGSSDRRNIQLLCAKCNIRKNACDPLDYSRKIGLLL